MPDIGIGDCKNDNGVLSLYRKKQGECIKERCLK